MGVTGVFFQTSSVCLFDEGREGALRAASL